MTRQNTADLLDSIALNLTVARENFPHGIPVGDAPIHIDGIDYVEDGQEIWLRLTDGTLWILRAYQLGATIHHEPDIGRQAVIGSYCQFRELSKQFGRVMKTAEAAGLDTDLLAQAWYDDVLSEDERVHWDRWTSCGTASTQEWDIVHHLYDSGTLTPEG